MALPGVVVIVALLLWLMGVFHAKVDARPPEEVLRQAPSGAKVLTVAAASEPVLETIVGTVEAAERIRVGSRLLARVKKVHVEAGRRVKAGDPLVDLDDRDLVAALAEAKAARDSAIAARDQAKIDLGRSTELLRKNVVSEDRVERDRTKLRRAKAEVDRSIETVNRAQTALGYATIRATGVGIVIEKFVEAGDLAQPGQDLVALYDPARLQLVASVREALGVRMRPGQKVQVRLDALDLECAGSIARIVPEASRASRSFQVEVTGPCPPGVMSGMFGRLIVPTGTREAIRVPRAAIRSVGQLDLCFVVREDGTLLRRFLRIGDAIDGRVEVLSGLRAGERILAVEATVQ